MLRHSHPGQTNEETSTSKPFGARVRGWFSWLSPRRVARTIRRHGWSAILPFVVCIGFFVWAYWFNSVMQVMCQRRENIVEATLRDPFGHIYARPHAHLKDPGSSVQTKHKDEAEPTPQPQPDFFHSILPFIHQWIICDILALSLMLLLVIKFTLLSSVRAVVVLKRFFLIQGLLFFFRGSSIYLTSQQIPLTTCVSNISDDNSAAVEALYIMIGLHRTCADLLFSGHAAFFTLGFLLVWTYGKGEEWTRLCGWGDVLRRQRAQLEEERRRAQEALASQSFAASPAIAAISKGGDEAGGFFQSGSAEKDSAPLPLSSTAPGEPHIVVSVVPFGSSSDASGLHGLADTSIPMQGNEQLRQEAHETLNRLHPWLIPELNGAGDPSTLTVSSLFMALYLVTGCFMLVSTHFHYSVDVLIGVLISWFTFHAYHSTLKTLHERRRGPIKRFITWIEHIPKVGEFVVEEEEAEQQRQARMQREHFEPTPAVAVPVAVTLPVGAAAGGRAARSESACPTAPTAPVSVPVPVPLAAAAPFHTYVYFSLTRNRYVLKRVREAEDIEFATRLDKEQAQEQAQEDDDEDEEGGGGGSSGQNSNSNSKDEERRPLRPKRNPASYTAASPPSRARACARARSASPGSSQSERKESEQRPLSRAEKLALDDEIMAKEDAADKYREHGIDMQSPF